MSNSVLTAANPFAFNRNMKAPIKGMARCKINVRPDKLAMTVRANALMNRFTNTGHIVRSIKFDGAGLQGEQLNNAFSLDDGDFAFVMRTAASSGTGRFGGNAQRDLLNNSMQAPVLSTLNGQEGNDADELMEKIQPIGIIEMGNRDNDENAANCLISGSVTITNKGDTNITIGDTVMVWVPLAKDNKTAITVNSNNPAEKILNGKGRVPLIPRRVNAHDIDYTNPQKLQRLMAAYGDAAHANEDAMRVAVKALNGDYDLIDGIAEAFVAGVVSNNATNAAFADDLRNANTFRDVKKRVARNYAMLLNAYLIDSTMATRPPGAAGDTVDNKKRPEVAASVIRFVKTAAALKLSKERLYVGRAMMSARPGEDFELFIQL